MGEKLYFRPIVQSDTVRSVGARPLAGGRYWFDRAEVLERGHSLGLAAARDIPRPLLDRLCSPRPDVAGLSMDRARIMSVVNVTPDSFSDGGVHLDHADAVASAQEMIAAGADILDIGGESTRPGADPVPEQEEVSRILPVLTGIRAMSDVAISVDTRKSAVLRAVAGAGVSILNDVSAGTFDDNMLETVAGLGTQICLMHAQGVPRSMQANPRYDDVLLDVYDYLEERIATAVEKGVRREDIIVDPGIGFGKTLEHNLRLLNNISLFHGLGCPILLGVSRKRFIGTIADIPEPNERMPGSVAVALAGIAQGVQIVRVHDTAETKQALALYNVVTGMDYS